MQHLRILQWWLPPEQSENSMRISLLHVNFSVILVFRRIVLFPFPPPSSLYFHFSSLQDKYCFSQITLASPFPTQLLFFTFKYFSCTIHFPFFYPSTTSVHPPGWFPSLLSGLNRSASLLIFPLTVRPVCIHCLFHSCSLTLLHRPSSNPITSPTEKLSTLGSHITPLYLVLWYLKDTPSLSAGNRIENEQIKSVFTLCPIRGNQTWMLLFPTQAEFGRSTQQRDAVLGSKLSSVSHHRKTCFKETWR